MYAREDDFTSGTLAYIRSALEVSRRFSDDSQSYCTEKLQTTRLRAAIVGATRRAKRNKAFANSRWAGLALGGTGAGRVTQQGCELCHPLINGENQEIGHLHHFAMVSVEGAGLSLPVNVEPWGPAGGAASPRLICCSSSPSLTRAPLTAAEFHTPSLLALDEPSIASSRAAQRSASTWPVCGDKRPLAKALPPVRSAYSEISPPISLLPDHVPPKFRNG